MSLNTISCFWWCEATTSLRLVIFFSVTRTGRLFKMHFSKNIQLSSKAILLHSLVRCVRYFTLFQWILNLSNAYKIPVAIVGKCHFTLYNVVIQVLLSLLLLKVFSRFFFFILQCLFSDCNRKQIWLAYDMGIFWNPIKLWSLYFDDL